MRGYIVDIKQEAGDNDNFRRVLYTSKNSQLVLMSIERGSEIGEEVHDLDQYICIESGRAKAIMDDSEHQVEGGHAIVIPAGLRHNIKNIGKEPLKLYTIYSPPEHKDKVIHMTREDAIGDEDHFDGITTE